jgi:tRNA-Thr(GGU) m(6)t(6)A37 methyltransferase TsaA
VTAPSELPSIEVRPIGVVRDAPDDLERLDWHDVESTIQLVGAAAEAADDLTLELEEYTHLIVLGWLDRYPEELRNRRTAYPGGDASLPLQGALALRGARPNPISFTVVELLEIDGDEIDVRGLDLVEGTPILDIKPYIAFYDAIHHSEIPAWAEGEPVESLEPLEEER